MDGIFFIFEIKVREIVEILVRKNQFGSLNDPDVVQECPNHNVASVCSI